MPHCAPGMIMAAVALGNKPSLDEIRVGLAGNLCRCTGYSAIYRSIEATTKGRNRRERRDRGVKNLRTSNRGERRGRRDS
jgi:xanthine dehydrogenase iron-sulfur cluster and FAD-binding subunit A